MSLTQILSEDNNSSRRMQGKRLLADHDNCKLELKEELSLLFKTFLSAVNSTKEELLNFNIRFRSRSLEASIMQSFFAEFLQENFGDKAFYGKYKRLVVRANGYLILFKKLNSKGFPMNIKTTNVQSILNQNQVLDLFADTDYNDEPILYFGYQKNRFGDYVNAQLIYIDEGEIKFSISQNDMDMDLGIYVNGGNDNPDGVSPVLKNNNNIKKAN
ncbi:hypothetical protein [Flavobacterium johnsoniae]|uniref:hypothetical protein n=1 Tax=Flavobacterium johnsoniae TaxID=986 RepID=UPI003D993D2C